jgi:hypothetical protein
MGSVWQSLITLMGYTGTRGSADRNAVSAVHLRTLSSPGLPEFCTPLETVASDTRMNPQAVCTRCNYHRKS